MGASNQKGHELCITSLPDVKLNDEILVDSVSWLVLDIVFGGDSLSMEISEFTAQYSYGFYLIICFN